MIQSLVAIAAAQVLIMLVALGRAKILSVILGPSGYGVVSTVDQTVISVVQLGGLSLPLAAMKFMARAHSENTAAFRTAFATFFRAIGMVSLVALAVSMALFVTLPGVFGADVATIRNFLFLALLGVPAAMLHILFVHTLASAQQNAASAWLSMFVLLGLTLAAVGGVLVGGIAGLYVATVSMGAFTTIMTLRYLRARLGVSPFAHTSSLSGELRRQPEIARYSFLLYSALAAYSLVMLLTRYYVFERLGAAGAGLFQALIGVALTLAAVPNAVSTLYLAPSVNRVAPPDEKVAAANDFVRRVLLFITVGGTVVALFPRLILSILFSAEFAAAAPALIAFVLWQSLHQIMNIYAQVLIGIDDMLAYAIITSGGYVAAALMFPPLVNRFELAGAGYALSFAALAMLVAATLRMTVRARASVSPDVVLRVLLCIGSISVGAFMFDVQSELQLRGLGGRGLYALIVLLLVILTLSRAEREQLSSVTRRARTS